MVTGIGMKIAVRC